MRRGDRGSVRWVRGEVHGRWCLVYFGYPQAHEDDAERAVRAGLELVAAVSALKTHAALQTRVGIATGLVVVGDLIGSGASQEQAIVGETPNLAARLQGIAEPNSVVIADSTRKLVGNLFELEDLGRRKSRALRADASLGCATSSFSGKSLRRPARERPHELVGREEELELLLRRWSKAKTGEGQVVLLSGEAGIGKSRLTAALRNASLTNHTRACVIFVLHSTLTARSIQSLARRSEPLALPTMTRADEARQNRRPTGGSLTPSKTRHCLPKCCHWRTMDAIPPSIRSAVAAAKVHGSAFAQVEALSRQSPVLMILEDAHWVDPTSLEAFGRAVERIRTLWRC